MVEINDLLIERAKAAIAAEGLHAPADCRIVPMPEPYEYLHLAVFTRGQQGSTLVERAKKFRVIAIKGRNYKVLYEITNPCNSKDDILVVELRTSA